MDKRRINFTGEGFDKGDLSEAERAQIRERSHHYDRNFLSAEDLIKEMGIGWLVAMAKGTPAAVKMFAAVGTIFGAIIALIKMGIL